MTTPKSKESTQEEQCIICDEKYTKIKLRIHCPKCNFECCKHCIQNYIISRADEPHCMSCKTQHNDEFLYETINKTFMNITYRKHKTNLLYEIEKSRIPETMVRVEDYKKNKKAQEEYKEISNRISIVRLEIYRLETIKARKQNIIERYRLGRIVNENPVVYGMPDTDEYQEEEKKKFSHNCPYEGCKGFLSSAWKCAACEKWACSKCFECLGATKDPNHVCEKENIESAILIRKETKPCPTCSIPIMKASGCDQMWCTQCKVAFSWKTGKIVMGDVIHNPHYYQYIQQHNEGNGHGAIHNPGDVACGGIPDYYHMRTHFHNPLRDLMKITNKYIRILNQNNLDDIIEKAYMEKYKEIHEPEIAAKLTNCKLIINKISKHHVLDFHRILNHNRDIIYRMRALVMGNQDGELREMRVKFIMGEIGEEKYKAIISKKEREHKKTVRILQIFELYETITIETYNNVYDVDVLNISKKEHKIYYSVPENTQPNTYASGGEDEEYIKTTLKFNAGAVDKILNYFKEVEKFIERCISIENYCNEELKKIKKQYNIKKYYINDKMINI